MVSATWERRNGSSEVCFPIHMFTSSRFTRMASQVHSLPQHNNAGSVPVVRLHCYVLNSTNLTVPSFSPKLTPDQSHHYGCTQRSPFHGFRSPQRKTTTSCRTRHRGQESHRRRPCESDEVEACTEGKATATALRLHHMRPHSCRLIVPKAPPNRQLQHPSHQYVQSMSQTMDRSANRQHDL